MLRILDVTDANDPWLKRAERVHRQLRPHLPSDYTEKMARVFRGGAQMSLAIDADDVTGVSVWRVYENTYCGPFLYVDDLVTDGDTRGQGHGAALLAHLKAEATARGCAQLVLDSGMGNSLGHRFYFREGLLAEALHFRSELHPASRI